MCKTETTGNDVGWVWGRESLWLAQLQQGAWMGRITPCRASSDAQRPVPPAESHGKLVAWNQDGTEIVASGDTFAEVKAKALAAGEKRVRYERIT